MREKLLVFLICSKQQLSQCERELFCIVDSQQMGVMSHICTDHKVSATPPSDAHEHERDLG